MKTSTSTNAKANWFQTLNEALESEDLLDAWEPTWSPIMQGDYRAWTYDDGSKYGRWVSVYRAEDGRYERPVHYKR